MSILKCVTRLAIFPSYRFYFSARMSLQLSTRKYLKNVEVETATS